MTKRDSTPLQRTTTSPQPPRLKERQLKVRQSYYEYQLKHYQQDRTPIGQIELKGHWLIQAGFEIDRAVKVRVMPGCLVLTTE